MLLELVLLADVEHLHVAALAQLLELRHRDGLELLRAVPADEPELLEEADRRQQPRRLVGLGARADVQHHRLGRLEHEGGARRERAAVERDADRTGQVPGGEDVHRARVEHQRAVGPVDLRERRSRRDPRAAVECDQALGRRRLGRRQRGRLFDEVGELRPQRVVRLALAADRARVLLAHVRAAQRPGDVPGVDDDRLAQLGEAADRPVQVRRPFARLDREVGSRRVADEERVAGQHELVVEQERAVLGAMTGCVEDTDRDAADVHRQPVLERLERILGTRERMDRNREVLLEREAAVT